MTGEVEVSSRLLVVEYRTIFLQSIWLGELEAMVFLLLP